MGHGEELIPMPIDEEILNKSMFSDVEDALSSNMSSGGSTQYGSEKELDTYSESLSINKSTSKKGGKRGREQEGLRGRRRGKRTGRGRRGELRRQI